jgi:hypothetical protein
VLCCAEPPGNVVLLDVQVASYSSCSADVDRVMSADVMRSCLVLVEDLLDVLPVLLYQVSALQYRPTAATAQLLSLVRDHTSQRGNLLSARRVVCRVHVQHC